MDSYDNLSFVVEDNDTAGVVIASIDNNSKESGNNGTLTVKLQSRPFDRVTVNFAADNGSFMETYRGIRLDPDYLIFDNTSSDNWSTPQTIQVVSYDDHLDEGEYGKDNQTFNVWLKNIINTGGHEHDSKFSDEIKALIVDGIDTDNLSLASEDNDTTGVVISSIDNNSKESGETGTVAIKLQSRPFGSLRVFLAADNASGRGIYLNPGFLNFDNSSGNWSSTQTIQIVSNDDDYDEGVFGSDNQTFNFWLDNVTNTGNDHEDNKSEANLNALIVDGINHDNISLASLDNDTAGVVISSYDNTSQENLADNGSIGIRLQSRPLDQVTVFLKVIADNLSHAVQLIPDNLSFSNSSDNWSTAQTILVLSENDSVDEGNLGPDNQTFYIALDNVTNSGSNNYDTQTYVDNVSATGKLVRDGSLIDNLTAFSLDNDTARVRMVSNDQSASESGDNASVQVVLESEPYHPVTIRITDNTSAFEKGIKSINGVVPENLTFGPDNWSDVQTFTLVAEDDQYDEGNFGVDNQTFLISLSSSTAMILSTMEECHFPK